ncbi:N-acetylmuramic acid 6-phosphate etherase [Ignavibacteria bacterium]|nr:N-acetylmuramic acid 6-phosphate etherase [Bacteroidota bacterium]MCZ2132791.1 N-acetylmuramic acid 6-phosphate etherase [Bacteroidota bacterium]
MNLLFGEICSLPTEQRNEATESIDVANAREILERINDEDAKVASAVRAEIPNIERAVEAVVARFRHGGRLIYAGAGTSGRLGVVDASECPPTFGASPEMVQAIIAGGEQAVFRAQEGAEDLPENGIKAIANLDVNEHDSVCGIAASGRTPFVRGALDEARRRGSYTIMISTNTPENLATLGICADVMICPQVGPEVIAGSTRMKSGTAQKLVLNMISTASMIRLGKTYGNIMVDLQITNAKLRERAIGILLSIGGVKQYEDAEKLLDAANGHVKTALVMAIADTDAESANKLIGQSDGFIRRAIESFDRRKRR